MKAEMKVFNAEERRESVETKQLSQENRKWYWFPVTTKVVLYLSGVMMIWRTFLFDWVWLLPRQPITGGLLGVVFPRLITLNCPGWLYSLVSPMFDGDCTPIFLVASYLVLAFLWLNHVRQCDNKHLVSSSVAHFFRIGFNFRTVCLLFLFLISPVSWLVRIMHAEMSHDKMATQLSQFGSVLQSRVYNPAAHLFNSHFDPDTVHPDFTFAYKNISLEELHKYRCEEGIVPGDVPMPRIKVPMYEQGKLELDVYVPRVLKDPEALPPAKKPGIILHIHGGGWLVGHRGFLSMNYHGGVPHYLLEENFIVSVSYRYSCHGITGPEILQDVFDAAKFVTEHAESWGADPTKIIPWGTSAGGTLALLLGYKFQDTLPIPGVINFYGVTELREQGISEISKSTYEMMHSIFFIKETRHICEVPDSKGMDSKETCFEDFSPIAHISPDSPPTLTIHGEQDGIVLVNQAQKLQQTLQENNVTEITLTVQGVHDCDVYSSSLCSQAAVFAIEKFLAHVF